MLRAFKQYAEEKCKLSFWAALQMDGRGPNVTVTPATLFKAVVHQVPIGISSLLQLDHWMRTDHARIVLGSCRRAVASDTLLCDALGSWDLNRTRKTIQAMQRNFRNEGVQTLHLETGRVCRPCIVDGSCFGNQWFSALVCVGDNMTFGLDVEPYEGRGHELAASRRLLKRNVKELGSGFATHLLYDGLVSGKRDISNALNEWGMHIVIKNPNEKIFPIEHAKWLFRSVTSKADMDAFNVDVISGFDELRQIFYEVATASNIRWKGLSLPLKTARITETHRKGKYKGQRFVSWLLTTDQTLLPREIRQLAYTRWRIENNMFKELNERVGSKAAYIKNGKLKEALLLIWFIGWSIFQGFLSLKHIKRWIKGIKITKPGLQLLFLSGYCDLKLEPG